MAKKPMSDEERLELCKKLDQDLDDFIDALPRKQYDEGWPEENWIEEFEKHPFFMKKLPEDGQELHPLYEGLQQLKYDPNENTADELAVSYKDDGNFNFKHKNYRLSVIAYTEGIKTNCQDTSVLATLYNNRAAANYFLKNYRSSLKDCMFALKLQPEYAKAEMRALSCCIELGDCEQGLKMCESILSKDADRKDVVEIQTKLSNILKRKDRDVRKREATDRKRDKDERMIVAEILKRYINIDKVAKGTLNLANLEPNFPELAYHRVSLNKQNRLVWPVVFLYPEYTLMDFLQEVCEDDLFWNQLHFTVFAEQAQWDHEGKYRPGNLNAYFENKRTGKVHRIDVDDTLGAIMTLEGFELRGGTPCFIIHAKGSPAEKRFLENY